MTNPEHIAEIFRLRAALAEAEGRIKHMSEVLVDAEELLGVEETGELILRPIERLKGDLAAARELMTAVRADLGPIHVCDVVSDRCAICTVVLRIDAFLERTAKPHGS